MTDTLFIPYISLLVLDEMGMTLRSSIPNPDISREEIMGMGNFYSPVISASSPNLEIYGPLPIPHFRKYHLLIVSFRKADSENRVMRSKATDNLSYCQLLIIYDKQCDQKVKFGHSKIFDTVESFLQQFTEINQITDSSLISLSETLIENILLDEQIKSKSIEDVVRDIASRFNTIQQISNLLNRRTKIGIITSDSLSYNLIIQSLFHYQNIDFIYEFSRNEYISRIDTYFMRIVLTLLFDLETIAGKEYFREMDYYIYLASCEDITSASRHIRNIDELRKRDPKSKIYLVTFERAEKIDLSVKKALFAESERRENVQLMITVGDLFRTLDNAVYLILNDVLALRNILLSKSV